VAQDTTVPDPGGRYGRYEVQQEIGEGAMGRVYRAFDPLVRRTVAIKTIRPEVLTQDTAAEYLRRFRREAQAMGPLSHPNIVSVFDVGEDYFVMEYVEGISLQSLLAERAPLSVAEALRMLAPVAEAIDYAHRFGIVHRDIKPANILIQPDGQPKLMDFGVARLATSVATGSGRLFGSPSYMAPEQIAADKSTPLTPSTDLFSFGVVAYEALTGRRPFLGDSVAAIVYRIVHEPAPPPRTLNDRLPPHCDDVFHRALAKWPDQRFPNALSFVAALGGEEITLPEALLAPIPASTPVSPDSTHGSSTGMETHLLKRRTDSLEPGESASRRWLPWALAAAALFVVAAEIIALGGAVPIRAPLTRGGPSLAGELRIETRPPGASVWIDERRAGEAPLSVRDLRSGLHRVRVSQDGYAPAELTFEIADGASPPPLRFVMAPLSAPTETGAVLAGGEEGRSPARREAPREGAPRPRRHQPSTVPLPLPKPVAEGDLVDLDDDVRPPRPLASERVPYPKEARRLRLQGTVTVEMIVDEKGVPRDPRILRSAGAVLDEAVIEAVYRLRYEPAAKDGVPVKVRQTYSQTFPP
jgi:serine/threonine-protein kinase